MITPSQKAKNKFKRHDAPEILDKQNEAIWFVNKKVIKYSKDINFIKGRIERSKLLNGFVPKVEDESKNMYSYTEITGKVMSRITNNDNFKALLEFLDKFWEQKKLSENERIKFQKTCYEFYKTKTKERLNLYFSKYSEIDSTEKINGLTIPPINKLLEYINWVNIANGIPSKYPK